MKYQLIGKKVLLSILDLCICIALFADTSSTGNLSMAVNGDGVFQAVTFGAIYLLLSKICVEKADFFKENTKREKIVFTILAALFSVFMLIGRYEEKHIVLDDTNSLDFVRVNLESFEDLCFLCHEYLIKGDFDNAAEILSRIEKINIEQMTKILSHLLMILYIF